MLSQWAYQLKGATEVAVKLHWWGKIHHLDTSLLLMSHQTSPKAPSDTWMNWSDCSFSLFMFASAATYASWVGIDYVCLLIIQGSQPYSPNPLWWCRQMIWRKMNPTLKHIMGVFLFTIQRLIESCTMSVNASTYLSSVELEEYFNFYDTLTSLAIAPPRHRWVPLWCMCAVWFSAVLLAWWG